jgi:hypothetical protein
MYKRFWSENLKGTDHSEDLDVDGKIILKWILGKGKVWTEFIWLRTWTNGRLIMFSHVLTNNFSIIWKTLK